MVIPPHIQSKLISLIIKTSHLSIGAHICLKETTPQIMDIEVWPAYRAIIELEILSE